MKDEKLKNGIDEIRNIVMTDVEKKRILENIYNTKDEVKKPVESPWSIYAYISMTKKSQLVYYIVIPLVMILSGGGVVFASQESLPNNILYPIKVKVIEPIEGKLILDQKEKAKYQSRLAKTRLIEAEILASNNKLDIKTEEKINNLLSDHTLALNNAINKATKDNNVEEINNISTDFMAEMNAHAKILDIITKHGDTNEEVNNNTEEDNKEKDLKKTKEIKNNEGSNISENARGNAQKVKNTLNKNNSKNKNSFINKKEEVRNLIDSTDKNLDNKNVNESTIDKKVKEDTHKSIDEAKRYLEDAEKKDNEGDAKEAYSSLLDSESSIKEIEILLKKEYKNREEHNDQEEKD